MDFKPAIVAALDALRKKELAEKQPFKARAYATVLQHIAPLPAIYGMSDLADIKGIGEKIRAKLEEIFATGASAAAERAKAGLNPALEELQGIYGIGPAKAGELVAAGVTSVEDLRSKQHLLTPTQRIGLQYYHDIRQRIPRAEMDAHAALLRRYIPAELPYEIVGSYRRGLADSGDIDVLFSATDMERAIRHFQQMIRALSACGYLTAILAEGEKKCLAICRVGDIYRRIDLLLTPAAEYPFAILHFTGSARFNIQMSQAALDRGHSLSEHGLVPKPKVALETEEAIFRFLGVPWVAPTETFSKRM